MSQFTSYRCDVCGAIKTDSNHWWKFTRLPGPRIVIFAWDCPIRDENATVLDLCGWGCAGKALSQAMSIEDPK